jgi:hypothetical protein
MESFNKNLLEWEELKRQKSVAIWVAQGDDNTQFFSQLCQDEK